MSVASEYVHAEQVVADVVLLSDMAAGRLDSARVREAAGILLEHRRSELPGVSVAVAARLLGVSRTTVESWRGSGVLDPASSSRRRHEVTIDSLARVNALVTELRRTAGSVTCAITCGGLRRTPPITPTASLLTRSPSCGPGGWARNSVRRRRTCGGRAGSWAGLGVSRADCRCDPGQDGGTADRGAARQAESVVPVSRRQHPPLRSQPREEGFLFAEMTAVTGPGLY